MNPVPSAPGAPRRVYLHESGWKVGQKVGSTREFCYMTAPGQDYYHRLLDGELYLHNSEERLCFACAERRGLLSFDPKGLRAPGNQPDVEASQVASGFDVLNPEER